MVTIEAYLTGLLSSRKLLSEFSCNVAKGVVGLTVKGRLALDLSRKDVKRIADQLWRKHKAKLYVTDDGLHTHSESPSVAWSSMLRIGEDEYGEQWENRLYYATVARFAAGFGIGEGPYIRIGISSTDETARHDWRDFQHIKNDIAGDDWEAVELYPAEHRLLDPSNRFYLWCVPLGVFMFGNPGERKVLCLKDSIAPQRPFATSR